MPLLRLLSQPAGPVTLRAGDVVFHLASGRDPLGRPLLLRNTHAGIAARDRAGCRHGDTVRVYHKDARAGIALEDWPQGVAAGPFAVANAVDAAGVHPAISPAQRVLVIDAATAFMEEGRLPYYIGAIDPARPRGVTCSSFVYHCYARAGLPLVDIADMPEIDSQERENIRIRYPLYRRLNRLPVGPVEVILDPRPFRLLYAGYLAGGFETGHFPFHPARCRPPTEWADWVDQPPDSGRPDWRLRLGLA